MLDIRDLNVSYGAIKAVRGLSLQARSGHITAIFGANGAGKSSVMQAVIGLVKHSGQISLNNTVLGDMSPNRRAALGLACVLEGRRLFRNLTVQENLELAWRFGRRKNSFPEMCEVVYQTFPILGQRRTQQAGLLSGGQQQMLIISSTTIRSPDYFLLDEPSLGLAPVIVEQVFDFILAIKSEFKTTILMSEQMASLGLRIADYGYVMRQGDLVLKGDRASLLGPENREKLKAAYL